MILCNLIFLPNINFQETLFNNFILDIEIIYEVEHKKILKFYFG